VRLAVLQNVVAPTRHALFRALAERVELEVLFMARSERGRGWRDAGPVDYPHRFLGGAHLPLGDHTLHLNPGVVRELRRFDAVLCSGFLSPTSWLALASRTPVHLWFAGSAPRLDPLKRAIVGRAAGVVAYGETARVRAEELGARRVAVALNTTDVDAFAGVTPAPAEPTLLLSGRLLARKRVDRALALAGVLGWKLLVAGDGPERRVLEGRAELLGERPYPELPAIYARATALVTLAEREPWGLVVNEALAAGLPVLAGTGVTAARELVPEGAGCVSDDLEELAAAARRFAGDASASAAARSVLPRITPAAWADAVVSACAR
jgi:glycosyltransferase involved in cell wall biosynthesis